VVFAENMTSNIRIVQSALRAGRKNKDEPNKIMKIILPIIDTNWNNPLNNDFLKIKEVIYQIGLEDELIIEKLHVYNIFKDNINNQNIENNKNNENNIIFNKELTDELKIKNILRKSLIVSYPQAIRILKNKNITSKIDYLKFCNKDIRFSTEPDVLYNDVFNWCQYLSIPTIYYDFQTCKQQIIHHLSSFNHINNNYLNLSNIILFLSSIDKNFPPPDFWPDYYHLPNITQLFSFNNIKLKKSFL
jgi:hypothetical protein